MEERRDDCHPKSMKQTNKERQKGGKQQDGKFIEIMEIVKNTRRKEGKRILIEILKRKQPGRMSKKIKKERELR